ncbi:MAG: NAD(P)-dependent oxidoreductase [Nanoarchaeota archaeon]|nr:NAD(P)-dependent oxidoreductase [Nanoarchaeota archaeon]
MKKKVLLIGANGRVGNGFREEYLKNSEYQKSYELILGVHNKKFKDKNLKTRYVSIDNLSSLKSALKGIDVVINLAANADPEAKFKNLINPNLIGAYNVFEAAVKASCPRVIFASSIHAIGGYGHGRKVKERDVPKPIDLYGATKVFGEALCYTFFSKYGLSCIAIRIGAYTSNNKMRNVCFSRHDYDHVISQRDMGQLLHKCIIAPKEVKYAILSGTSKNSKLDMDLRLAKKLVGYKPEDNSYKICKEIKTTGLK